MTSLTDLLERISGRTKSPAEGKTKLASDAQYTDPTYIEKLASAVEYIVSEKTAADAQEDDQPSLSETASEGKPGKGQTLKDLLFKLKGKGKDKEKGKEKAKEESDDEGEKDEEQTPERTSKEKTSSVAIEDSISAIRAALKSRVGTRQEETQNDEQSLLSNLIQRIRSRDEVAVEDTSDETQEKETLEASEERSEEEDSGASEEEGESVEAADDDPETSEGTTFSFEDLLTDETEREEADESVPTNVKTAASKEGSVGKLLRSSLNKRLKA